MRFRLITSGLSVRFEGVGTMPEPKTRTTVFLDPDDKAWLTDFAWDNRITCAETPIETRKDH